ncbi:ABC transporter substrate-binding protein [Aldersonia kunmingensis]|uniref:ABC transporter substrate-binding protein n=1 Tax=Aldersonia kunmingensis TaxID=408066 RepID=UPI00082D3825|nr:ABC transporter substrate-binding protein [Aldersonia kunmingensis]
MKRSVPLALAATVAASVALAGCSIDQATGSGDSVKVVIGYQSKTINTVTAGTLLKALGYLEQRLQQITDDGGAKYQVEWQDYDTGAPITAQMVAEKIDIGSMGDYPLLINGSRTQANERSKTEFVSVTGYNPKGALNMVVVAPNSTAQSLNDLAGQKVSASVGSAGHGTLVQGLTRAGIDPVHGVDVLNQQPQVGASALESGQVAGLSQFVAWPGLLVFQDKAKLLYDGAELNVPTFHGVVARKDYTKQHPEVLDAFLQAQADATDFIHEHPLEAAKLVADGSGLPQEVVYLYNGPGGTSFDTTLKPSLIEAFKGDVQYLKSIGDFAELNIDEFVNDEAIRKVFAERGEDYDATLASTTNPTPGTGNEVWFSDSEQTQQVEDPTALLRAVKTARAEGKTVREAYVIGTELGTRWFADKAVWVRNGDQYAAFGTNASAQRYIAQHPGSVIVGYDQAVAEVRP